MKYLGIEIDLSRDALFDEQGYSMLTSEGLYKLPHETSPQHTLARMATCFSFGDLEFAQRIYDYASKKWFMGASPVVSNAIELNWPSFSKDQWEEAKAWLVENANPNGMPISCFKSFVPDTKAGLVKAATEQRWMSMMGGGVGIVPSMRSPDDKSTGVMAHIATYDKDTLAYKQTQKRRGSASVNLKVDHPEIMAFLTMRDPSGGGDTNKKCFNINSCVCITDAFMWAVIKGEQYELVDPKHGPTGRYLNARTVWETILEQRWKTGEPYLFFIDTVNRNKPDWITNPEYHVSGTNLCVAPETLVLTDVGHLPIIDLEGQAVNVWNGEQWSMVDVVKTGENQKLVKVVTDFGQELVCTEYHKWYVQTDYKGTVVEKRTHELKAGDKLIKFDLPVIEGSKTLAKAYTNGFFTGDGTTNQGKCYIDLYHEKRKLKGFIETEYPWNFSDAVNRERARVTGVKPKFYVPSADYTVESRLEWLAGWVDADGTVTRNGTNHSIQATSVEKEFLQSVQLMLQTLGVTSKVQNLDDGGLRKLPKNDGSGEYGDYMCKPSYRLLISSNGLYKLSLLGFKTHRLQWDERLPQREAERFVTIKEVVDEGRYDSTYCFSEPKRHMGMFNGILTGQCSEITLFINHERSAVCCLSSVNDEYADEWKDTQMIADLVRFLDNVLEYFILLAPKELDRAVFSAQQERAIGIGEMGFHSYLQKKMIPFESGGFGSAVQVTHMLRSKMKEQAIEASKQLAKERGEAPDCKGSGMRNSHLFAIAPNGNSADILGTSPSREPYKSNAYLAEGRAGSFIKKNKWLKRELEKLDMDTPEIWDSIMKNDGSVQHLEGVGDRVKKVFKTFREIDGMWVVEQAAAAQKDVCQSISTNLAGRKSMTKQQMSDWHMKAFEKGLKALYYFRAEGEKIKLGSGGSEPLNAIPSEYLSIDFHECLSCEG